MRRTWILNAAAVLSGRHGAIFRRAQQAGGSRQTVYQHARKLEQRLAAARICDRIFSGQLAWGDYSIPGLALAYGAASVVRAVALEMVRAQGRDG